MDLGISTNPTPEIYTIKVTGEIDISTPIACAMLSTWRSSSPLRPLSSILPGELHRFDGHWRARGRRAPRGRHGKRFSCTNVQPQVMRVVQLLGVDQEISITAA